MISGLVDFYIKGVLARQVICCLLELDNPVSLGSASPQMPEHQEHVK